MSPQEFYDELKEDLLQAESVRRILDKIRAGQDIGEDVEVVLDALLFIKKDYDKSPFNRIIAVENQPISWDRMFYEWGFYNDLRRSSDNKGAKELADKYWQDSHKELKTFRSWLDSVDPETAYREITLS